MGQNLTHGVYLPDEGERNCYNGLAANWSILDGAVGTIAEHTTQIAGKAPAVHTHTKADITDFPAYGNSAGTICEGNDSRLSDARTPVAHTHVTADITDLLNTAHGWSKTQTYSNGNAIVIKNSGVEIGNEPSAYNEQRVVFNDKNGYGIAAIKYQNQLSSNNVFINGLEFSASDKFKDGVRDPTGTTTTTVLRIGLWNDGTKYIYNEGRWRSNLLPFGNNTNDVGSSSYQWNNLYAKNYYYNGVAWGLDTFNQWTGNNKFVSPNTNFGFKSTTAEAGSLTAASNWIYWQDKNNFQDAYISRDVWSDGSDSLRIAIVSKRSNGAPSTTGTEVGCGFRLNILANGNISIDPFDNGGTDLGTSTNKWKTLNGINPGALSLPNVNAVTGSSNTQLQDISGDLVQDQYFNCYFTPRMDGWAYIALNCSSATIRSGHSSYTVSVKTARSFADAMYTQSFTKNENAWLSLQIFIPVTANKEITLECTFTGFSVTKAYVIPAQGNV